MGKDKKFIGFCIFILMLIMTSCSNKQLEVNDQWQLFRKEKLTLEKVIDLSHKKQELSWNDFDRYDSKEIGSGLYILRYEIEEGYYLLIGGNHPTQKPLYIKLIQTKNPENYIDIRKNSVEDFISK
ncbi:hypothetical protein J2Z32_001878 [Paenibacillus turicensis]|uniref:Lipoprotein n=1 Tax=Paenibacillus turicensis TaxID=160487 RepID=A0ABS4FRQ2_9BACL|nr:hypothetical protein [Paenibacillus turicensis]MBP1905250.1 hypothetical protein [Paenibacillus turicensis]